MNQYLRFLCGISFLVSLVFTACRDAPKLEQQPWDSTVKVRISGDPESLGYLYVTDDKAIQIVRQIFLPLADFHPETYELVPVLAKNLPIVTEITEGENVGSVSYEYEIKEQATWFDGSPVTGHDYLFTIKAMFNPNNPSIYKSQFKRITKLEVDESNPKKFTIYSKPYMMGTLAFSNFAPLPEYLFDSNKTLRNYALSDLIQNKEVAGKEDLQLLAKDFSSPKFLRSPEIYKGSGPYHLTNWTTGQEIILEKRQNWWGELLSESDRTLRAIPKKIIYKMIPDLNAAVSLMKNGELDIATQMDWNNFLSLKENADFAKAFNFYTPDKYALRMMHFNTLNEKLADKKVRRAIAHLLDREEIFETVYYGYPTAVAGPIYPTKSAYNKDLKLLDFDIGKAKSLLREAGWEDSNNNGIVDKNINGEQVELELKLAFANGNKDLASVATIFQEAAFKAGINLKPDIAEGATYLNKLKGKNFEIAFSGIGDYPMNMDPIYSWYSRGPSNYTSFGTPESDKLIIEIRNTIDPKKQDELLKKLQQMIYDEQPGIFICAYKDRIVAHKKFGKIATHGLTPGFAINEFSANANIPVMSGTN